VPKSLIRRTAAFAAGAAVAGAAAPSAHAAEYIVQFKPGATPDAIARAGGTVTRELRLIDAAGAQLTPAQAATLRRAGNLVTRNGGVTPTGKTGVTFDPDAMATAYNQSARTSSLWPDATGRGVGVAVLDTGISDSPDFRVSQANPASRVIAAAVVNPNATSAADGYGHGTLVAGLVAGNGGYRPSGDPLFGSYAGAAPDANLISVKISDDAGDATVLDAINGLEFAVEHKADLNIRVVNLSFQADTPQSYKTDPLDAAVESAWLHGIVVVAAAGNRGTAADAVSYAPGNDPYVITVGGVDDKGSKDTRDDLLASWSSRGVTQDGFAKPEIAAPGAHIVGPLAPGSAFAVLCPTCVRSGAYIQAGGSSLAAPIVAGAAAALLQVHPTWTPDQVKGAILASERSNNDGSKELDAHAAERARKLTANVGLTPSTFVAAATGEIDYTKATWTKATWTKATWTKATWTCVCATGFGGVDPTKATWTKATWTTDWSK
jgi:serine protease AprX